MFMKLTKRLTQQLTRIGLAAVLLFTLNLQLSTAHAQGTQFTYQGRLDSGGSPVNGSNDLTFTLYNAATLGATVGTSNVFNDLLISNGLFTVTLDFGAGAFNGSARWLQIAARPGASTGAYTNLAPRQPVTATPYAIMSANAGTAAALSGNVSAGQITGVIPVGQLPASVLTNGATGVNLTGAFSGNGAGLTGIDLRNVNGQGVFSIATNSGIFVLASSPGVGSGPLSVTSADVNGDGKPDLISANFGGTLTVLTNNGSGGFVLASSPGVGPNPRSVTAADVNGDGKPDLISANYGNNSLTVLTNNGSGGFGLSSSPFTGTGPWSVTAADVNGDGRADLINANVGASTLTVSTNNGSGGFVLSSSPGVGGGAPESVTSADVNGDGRPDLISANVGANTLTVLTNNGSGGFVLSSSPAVGNFPRSVTAADVNGDGKPDLISANFDDDTLTVLMNNGSGGFVLSSSPAVGNSPRSVTAADVNGDGKPDLISANYDANTLTVLINNGSGGFVLASSPGVGNNPLSVTAADVNGDGRPDLISANVNANTLTVLFNTATYTGNFTGHVGIGTTTPGENLSITTTTSTPSEASATLSLSSFGGNTWILNSVSGFGGGHNNAPPGSLQFYNANSDTSPLVLQAGAVGIGGPAVSLDKLTVSGQYLGLRSPDLADLIMVGNNDASRMDVALTAGAGQFSSSAALGDSVIRNIGGKVHLQSGSGAAAVTIDTANSVGIGTSNPQVKLDVNGAVRAIGFSCRPGIAFAPGGNLFNVNWTGSAAQLWIDNVMVGLISLTSDRRLKEEVQPMTGSAIERVMALKPVTFKYKNIAGTPFTGSPITQEGFIADQVQQVVPSGVNGKNDALTKEGQIQPQTLNPLPLISVLTKATQELARKLAAQESELTDLRAELSQLRSEKTSLTKLASEMEARFVRLEQAMHKTTVPAVKDVSASADVK